MFMNLQEEWNGKTEDVNNILLNEIRLFGSLKDVLYRKNLDCSTKDYVNRSEDWLDKAKDRFRVRFMEYWWEIIVGDDMKAVDAAWVGLEAERVQITYGEEKKTLEKRGWEEQNGKDKLNKVGVDGAESEMEKC